MLYITFGMCRYMPVPYVWLLCGYSHLTCGRTEQHTIFTYQTCSTQFIDAPEDGPVGLKYVELSNIL